MSIYSLRRHILPGTLAIFLLAGCSSPAAVAPLVSHSSSHVYPPLLMDLSRQITETAQQAQTGQGAAQQRYGGWLTAAGDDGAALPLLQSAAEKGHVEAQYRLGILMLAGGAYQDVPVAVRWLTLAGNQGYTPAQRRLAQLYSQGEGVTQNMRQAFDWNLRAAQLADTTAQNDVGAAYTQGQGVARDHAKALRWYRKAAEQGFALAQFNLAGIYQTGVGLKAQPAMAYAWYAAAADNAREPRLRKAAEYMKLRMFTQASRQGKATEARRLAQQYGRLYAINNEKAGT